jgi:hypothetical protein
MGLHGAPNLTPRAPFDKRQVKLARRRSTPGDVARPTLPRRNDSNGMLLRQDLIAQEGSRR